VLLALPRGGVVVADAVSEALSLPMDVFLVRKLGVPGHEELAMGAIASGGVTILNHDLIARVGITEQVVEAVIERETRELARRARIYRGDRPEIPLRGRVAILIDDGLATGATMRAAVRAARKERAARVIVAVPVAPTDTCEEL